MSLSMCCCGGRYTIPDCFNCGGTKSAFQFTEMQLELSGFGWDLTSGSWCSGSVDYYSYDYGTSPPTITYVGTVNADLHLTVPSLSALNTTITLQEKPTWYNTSPFYGGGLMAPTPVSVNGGCHWLWNYVRAVHATGYRAHWSVTGSGAVDVDYPQVLDQYAYEPVTPSYYDSTSMWGREYNYTDSRCGTVTPSSLTQWICSNHVYGFTVRIGTLTNPVSWPAGKYWWVSVVGFPLLFTYTDATGTAPNGARPVSPNPGAFGNCMGPCGQLPFPPYVPDPANGIGQPEYCFRQSSQLPGRMDLEYIKIIDCENDFTGDPLTLELYKRVSSNDLAGVTQPETITLVPVIP